MKTNQVYFQQGGGDEQYTPAYGVEVLLPHIQHLKDKIIWCPSYQNKRSFWERALDLKKPFTLLLPLNILSDSVINTTMRDREREFQLLIPSRRMRFFNAKNGRVGNQPTFKAAYFGVNIFQQQIILQEMKLK